MLLAACKTSLQQYECASPQDCTQSGLAGTCEESGYCSFPDSSCESGRRYGEQAGELSRQCTAAGRDAGGAGVDARVRPGPDAMLSGVDGATSDAVVVLPCDSRFSISPLSPETGAINTVVFQDPYAFVHVGLEVEGAETWQRTDASVGSSGGDHTWTWSFVAKPGGEVDIIFIAAQGGQTADDAVPVASCTVELLDTGDPPFLPGGVYP